ncbi:MAG: hypothetical protein CVV44_11525 [Spirochaetae bacterium HGW-Spirochaetae-1]|jgi:vacuolar-type H+-ATPase subunit H|nr:MAG: hypothetical protein CVV44_11525 [Spirochaetae bacterium HGW-Spirochaetae-1]
MTNKLITDIKEAEKHAADIINEATREVEKQLERLEEEYENRIKMLQAESEKRKQETRNRAALDAARDGELKERETREEIEKIRQRGMKKKDEVVAFLLNKIME